MEFLLAVAWGWEICFGQRPMTFNYARIRSELLGLSSVLAFELSEIAGEDVIGLYYWPGLFLGITKNGVIELIS